MNAERAEKWPRLVALGLTVAAWGGCAGPSAVERRMPAQDPAREPAGWELVLASGDAGGEYWRRDQALNAHLSESHYPLDLYPTGAPTLERWYWLNLPRDPQNVLVLRPSGRWYERR